jgi:phage tail P2-like protein
MQHAIETAGARLMDIDLQPLLVEDVDQVPLDVLEHLAEQYGVEKILWKVAENETNRRALVKGIIAIKRKRGTPLSVRDIVRALGYGDITIEERIGARLYDGSGLHDGHLLYGPDGGWAMFNVILQTPVTNDRVAQLRDVIAIAQGARNHLIRLDYTGVAIRYNSNATYNGAYNHGAA